MRAPFETEREHAIGGQLHGVSGIDLDDWLVRNAGDLVARELATLSSAPVYVDGRLEPRPMSLRVFLARTETGWQVMPGGFARLAATTDARAISLRRGGTVADVWVVSDTPVAPVSLVAASDQPFQRAAPGALPAQAADNLFWVGRYVERTEALLRLVRAYNARLEEPTSEALLASIRAMLADLGADAAEPFPQGVLDTLQSAILAASQIRDRFNVDAWAALMDMEKSMHRIAARTRPGADAASVASVMLRKIAGFSGLVHENMYRTAAWQFLTLGRSIERAAETLSLVAAVTRDGAPEGGLDLAIELGDSLIVHRQRYSVASSPGSVIDLLVLDGTNPRSAMFHINRITDRLRDLSHMHADGRTEAVVSRAMAVQSAFLGHSVETLGPADLLQARSDLFELATALQTAFIH